MLLGEEWLMSRFLAANKDAMRQTMAIKGRLEEERVKRMDQTKQSFAELSRSQNRPITPTKGAAIPFLDRTLPSAMKPRPKIPRTPYNAKNNDETWKKSFVPASSFRGVI